VATLYFVGIFFNKSHEWKTKMKIKNIKWCKMKLCGPPHSLCACEIREMDISHLPIRFLQFRSFWPGFEPKFQVAIKMRCSQDFFFCLDFHPFQIRIQIIKKKKTLNMLSLSTIKEKLYRKQLCGYHVGTKGVSQVYHLSFDDNKVLKIINWIC